MASGPPARSPEYLAESRVPAILAGTIAPTLLCTLAVLARFYTRLFVTRNWGVDDTFIAFGWLAAIGVMATNIILTKNGAGHHQELMTMDKTIATLQIAYASRIIYVFGITVTKLGIAIFYLRVFRDKTSTYLAYAIIAAVGICGIVLEGNVIFQCKPISGNWDLKPAKCLPNVPVLYAIMGCNVVGDLLLMAFAIPRIIPLKMSLRQKIPLLGVVSLGILVIVSSILRCMRTIAFNANSDLTWGAFDVTTFTSIEMCTALFCASAPTIRPLIRQIIPGLMSSSNGADSGLRVSKYGVGSSRRQGLEGHELGRSIKVTKSWVQSNEDGLSDSDSQKAVLTKFERKDAVV